MAHKCRPHVYWCIESAAHDFETKLIVAEIHGPMAKKGRLQSGSARAGEWLAVVALALAGGACDPSVHISRSGPEVPARPENCRLRMFTTVPEGYREIATVDVASNGAGMVTTLEQFKWLTQRDVCLAGGDAVMARMNASGIYFQGAILKREIPARAAPPRPPNGSGDDECHYDTQCKGDRICEDGVCEDHDAPPPASSGGSN
jgi:hypothetical protein